MKNDSPTAEEQTVPIPLRATIMLNRDWEHFDFKSWVDEPKVDDKEKESYSQFLQAFNKYLTENNVEVRDLLQRTIWSFWRDQWAAKEYRERCKEKAKNPRVRLMKRLGALKAKYNKINEEIHECEEKIGGDEKEEIVGGGIKRVRVF